MQGTLKYNDGENEMKKITILLIFMLAGCIPEAPEVPTKATCTADGWHVDIWTGEIITDDGTGSAIKCDFE